MKFSDDFTIKGYLALLAEITALGYSCRTFLKADPKQRDLILRHDIDMSLEAGLEMAEAEAETSISATYFILLRSEFYNPNSARNRDRIRRLLQFGHGVGLHFDASLYGEDIDALSNAAAGECEMLEQIAGHAVEVISFHRPAKVLLGLPDSLAGRVHAYQPRYFSEMGYCSDSRGAWNFGLPFEQEAVENGRALQLLTHPIWWTGEVATPKAKLKRFLFHLAHEFDQELAAQCEIHNPSEISAPCRDAT